MAAGGAPLVLAALLLLAGCRSADPLDPSHAGRAVAYAPGALAFDVEATADTAGVDVRLAIPPVSLTFRHAGEAFAARYRLDLHLIGEISGMTVAGASASDTLREALHEQTRTSRPHLTRFRLEAPPGPYRLKAMLRDEATGRAGTQELQVRVAAPGVFSVNAIQLAARLPGDSLRPLLSLHVPSRVDTLRATVVCTGVPAGAEAFLTLHVVRFETDTLAAEVPHGYTGQGSLAYRGVRLENADTVYTARRLLRGAPGAVAVAFDLPGLSPGLYRFVAARSGGPGVHRQERLLAVKPAGFPRVQTMGEMAEALGYLLSRRKQRQFAAATTPEAQRALFDRLWGRMARNREDAHGRLRRYFDRVEEANLRFSGYKSGWKTDRGMIYVVLGPPLHAEVWPDREVWHYSYDEGHPQYTYVFERVRAYDSETPFDHFVLVRSGAYQEPWERAVQAWRRRDR